MKKAKKRTSPREANTKGNPLKKYLESKVQALETLAPQFQLLEEAVLKEVGNARDGEKLLREYRGITARIKDSFDSAQKRKLPTYYAWKQVATEVNALKQRMREPLISAYSKHQALFVNEREVIEAYHQDRGWERNWVVTLSWLPVLIFRPATEPKEDVIVLGGEAPPPFNLCSGPPYGVTPERRTWTTLIGSARAEADQTRGTLRLVASGNFNGGGAAKALIGADLAVPEGYSQVEVRADVDWNYFGWSMAILGVAGCGADLILDVDLNDGSGRRESTRTLFSLISPVAWGNSVNGSGNTVLSATFPISDSSARNVRVFAGFGGHSEVVSTFGAGSQTIVSGTVKSICVTAT